MTRLVVNPQQVDVINALLPSDTRVSAVRLTDNAFTLGADLLTDCDTPTDTYYEAREILHSLPQREITSEEILNQVVSDER